MKRLNSKGFSMIELLVVLLIIGILAAVATPIFLQNADKSRLGEAVSGAGAIRSAERTYYATNTVYLSITAGGTYFDTGGTNSTLLGIVMHGTRYFSGEAYTVTYPATAWPAGVPIATAPQDYLITVNGANSLASTTDGAPSASQVSTDEVVMDNNGTIFYSINSGSAWAAY